MNVSDRSFYPAFAACVFLLTISSSAEEIALYDNLPEALPSFDESTYAEAGPPGIPEIENQPYNAQPFRTGDYGNISSVGVYLINRGTAKGSLKVSLMNDIEGLPGEVIADLGSIDLESLPLWNDTNSIGEVVTLNTPVAGLIPNTRYHIGFDNSEMVDPSDNFPQASFFQLHTSDPAGTRNADPGLVRPFGPWEPLTDFVYGTEYRFLRIMESDDVGFLGHEIAISARAFFPGNTQPDFSPFNFETTRVGTQVELESELMRFPNGATLSVPGFDLASQMIDADLSILAGNVLDQASFNGFVLEDANGTLPDFLAVRVDSDLSTFTPDEILVSPNSIWINFQGQTIPDEARFRLHVDFSESPASSQLSLTISNSGNLLLDSPVRSGRQYQFEESKELSNFNAIDRPYTPESSSLSTFFKPSNPRQFFRLRQLD